MAALQDLALPLIPFLASEVKILAITVVALRVCNDM